MNMFHLFCTLLPAASLCFLAAGCTSVSTASQTSESERLIWSDEFNTNGCPDPTKWTYEHGFVRNKEMQWYTPENAEVRDGKLIITGKKVKRPNPNYVPGSKNWTTSRPTIEYTSACLHSKAFWTYGRIQVRARLQAEEGLWPAIWFLGDKKNGNVPWPKCGEIDLLEYYQETILANFCWSASTKDHAQHWNPKRIPIKKFIEKSSTWRNDWHIWEMVRTPERIDLLIDGEVINSQNVAKARNADGERPFSKPMHLLLNLAMGSTGGSLKHTHLPATFEVDWVRVWGK